MSAYFLSNNGLGDNLYSVGALRFLCQFYENIYFLCKDKYYDNVKLFFIDEPKIIVTPFDANNEVINCKSIIQANYDNNDIFICGTSHRAYLNSKITNTNVLSYKKNDKGYDLNYDTLCYNDNYYDFIRQFYNDIDLDLSIFYDYFRLPSTDISEKLYQLIKNYNIIFIHTTNSVGCKLKIDNVKQKYINDENTILICFDQNLYDNNNNKYEICKPFIYTKLIYLLDTIVNSSEIYIIDSCFTGIVLPLVKTNQLNAKIVRIIRRDLIDDNIL